MYGPNPCLHMSSHSVIACLLGPDALFILFPSFIVTHHLSLEVNMLGHIGSSPDGIDLPHSRLQSINKDKDVEVQILSLLGILVYQDSTDVPPTLCLVPSLPASIQPLGVKRTISAGYGFFSLTASMSRIPSLCSLPWLPYRRGLGAS